MDSNIFATFAPYEKRNVSTDSVLAKSDFIMLCNADQVG